MTLPTSGPLSARQINVELRRSGNARFDMNATEERKLAKKTTPGSTIKYSDFRGKSIVELPKKPTLVGWGTSNQDEMKIRNDNAYPAIIRFRGHGAWHLHDANNILHPGHTAKKVVDIHFPLEGGSDYWYEVWFEDPVDSSIKSPKLYGGRDRRSSSCSGSDCPQKDSCCDRA